MVDQDPDDVRKKKDTSASDEMDQLKEWHFLWIEAVAKSWSDPAYRSKLLANPNRYLDIHALLGSEVTLTLKDGDPSSDAWRGSFWLLPYTEVTLMLPVPPATGAAWGYAMAAYEAQIVGASTTLAGRPPPGGGGGSNVHTSNLSLGGEGTLVAFDQMVRWIHVWPQAVALAWHDAAFKEHLLSDPVLALWNAFNFQFPGGVLLRVQDVPAGAPYGTWDGTKGRWTLPPIALTLILPPPPESGSEQAMALGAYASSGRTHPFTLCCC
ncbi:BMA_0021/BMA_0022 family TOMM bacteriocin [Chondromyces apiculatus]|uniref:Uncharacterized protein n=1 Tax=Chondromyces apiculatus DSM 436 TaxID=1192034 RepID=A0A017TC58_9BACT|nr:BMA_0021/BMA_0022 family TOMM bacteriocin [Chondromyces apiculatus]EYF06487.1 Hypothetical protein CAP_2017 [Chondromyces apiculatus DSM 436]